MIKIPATLTRHLHHQRIRTRYQDEVSGKGKEHAGAKHRQPFFSALDDGLQDPPSKPAPVPRHHKRKEEGRGQ